MTIVTIDNCWKCEKSVLNVCHINVKSLCVHAFTHWWSMRFSICWGNRGSNVSPGKDCRPALCIWELSRYHHKISSLFEPQRQIVLLLKQWHFILWSYSDKISCHKISHNTQACRNSELIILNILNFSCFCLIQGRVCYWRWGCWDNRLAIYGISARPKWWPLLWSCTIWQHPCSHSSSLRWWVISVSFFSQNGNNRCKKYYASSVLK